MNIGNLIFTLPARYKTLVRKTEKENKKIANTESSLVYNTTCLKENLLPTYTNIYIYIYIVENHRVIILNRGIMPRKRTGSKWCKFSRPQCATSQAHSVTSLETARSLAIMALVGGGALREKYVFCVPRELQRLLSLFCLWEDSVGGA